MNVLGTATDQEMTASTQSSPARQTVQPPVQTQQLETTERWKFSAKVSDSLIGLRLFRDHMSAASEALKFEFSCNNPKMAEKATLNNVQSYSLHLQDGATNHGVRQ